MKADDLLVEKTRATNNLTNSYAVLGRSDGITLNVTARYYDYKPSAEFEICGVSVCIDAKRALMLGEFLVDLFKAAP